MIQTVTVDYMIVDRKDMSQSSIRPGDDSDRFSLDLHSRSKPSRNPVFALEMIQTVTPVVPPSSVQQCRNPVFALEMIQTRG